jgi:DNA-directed RNA polymerase subunit RPC12/RpoP
VTCADCGAECPDDDEVVLEWFVQKVQAGMVFFCPPCGDKTLEQDREVGR